jgi:NTP pyrophosphatase (non-canonical NTP hydrolase)
MDAGPYSIGSGHWPGLGKLVEECGEVIQVAAKLVAANGSAGNWDGSELHGRLIDELADVEAAIDFVLAANGIERERLVNRQAAKLAMFWRWHDERHDGSLNRGDDLAQTSENSTRMGNLA